MGAPVIKRRRKVGVPTWDGGIVFQPVGLVAEHKTMQYLKYAAQHPLKMFTWTLWAVYMRRWRSCAKTLHGLFTFHGQNGLKRTRQGQFTSQPVHFCFMIFSVPGGRSVDVEMKLRFWQKWRKHLLNRWIKSKKKEFSWRRRTGREQTWSRINHISSEHEQPIRSPADQPTVGNSPKIINVHFI